MRVYTIVISAFLVLASLLAASYTAQADPKAVSQPRMLNLEMKNTSVKDAIDSLFKGTGLKYEVDTEVTGNVVELTLKAVTFEQGLKALADAAGFTYRVVGGVYVIDPVPSITGYSPPVTRIIERGQAPTEQWTTQTSQSGAGPQPQPQSAKPTQPAQQPPAPAPVPQVYVTQSQNAPVIYNQPSGGSYDGGYGAYGSIGPYAYPPAYMTGSVRPYGGWGGGGGGWGGGGWGGWQPMFVGSPPTLITHDYLPPPPPGYVGPELQRFLQTQYVIKGRPYFVPIY